MVKGSFSDMDQFETAKGIELGNANLVRVLTTIYTGQMIYQFPKDMKQLVNLSIRGHAFSIAGGTIELSVVPPEDAIDAITLDYVKDSDA